MTAPRRRDRTSLRAVVGAVLVALGVAVAAPSPQAAAQQAPRSEPTLEEMLDDYMHFVLVANTELAAANARAILGRDPEPGTFLAVIEDEVGWHTRFEQVYRRAQLYPELESLSARLWNLFEEGRRQRARRPAEIERNIELLNGTAREWLLAEARLLEAREYAVPQLLDAALRGENVATKARAQDLLVRLGRATIRPAVAALAYLDAPSQERLVRILGQIPYTDSLPYLYELRATTDQSFVREAATESIRRIEGELAADIPIASRFRELANTYFTDRHAGTMLSFPGERHQLLWDFLPGVGLQPTAIYTEVFHEAMTMREAEHALELEASDPLALSLWVLANFSRELDQPEGYDNPAYSDGRREAMYYAVASGPEVAQRALARTLRERETVLSMRTIDALGRIAGAETIWEGLGDRKPLVDALTYPDRRVQYEAAMAIAAANPSRPFPNAELVTQLLASLVREAGERFAVVVATDIERQQELRSALLELGYTVLPPVATLPEARADIARAPGVDLLAVAQTRSAAAETLALLRDSARLAATPALVLLPASDMGAMRSRYADDHLTRLARETVDRDALAENVRQLVEQSTGEPLTDEEAERYALRALEALDDLAIAASPVLSVRDATLSLVSALEESDGAVRLSVARVLSHIRARAAQVALLDAALESSGDERVALLRTVAASARRYGALVEETQIRKLREVAETGEGEAATAAASAMGALGLSGDVVAPLILGAR